MAETAADPREWERVLAFWNELDVPENLRVVQVTAEGVLMVPSPARRHVWATTLLRDLLSPLVRDAYAVSENLGVAVPKESAIFIPDLVMVPREVLSDGDEQGSSDVPAALVLLAVEITSPWNAGSDRQRKRRAYAVGGIPQYLLVDAFDAEGPSVTLFTRPSADDYEKAVRVSYGGEVALHVPFPIPIDTGMFPRPS